MLHTVVRILISPLVLPSEAPGRTLAAEPAALRQHFSGLICVESLVTQATENEWGQATTPGSGSSLPRTIGQEAPAAQSTARSSPKTVSRGSHIPIRGPSLPQSSGLCFCSPVSATGWLAAHSPGGPQANLTCSSSALKECGATVGFRHLCGLGEGLAS